MGQSKGSWICREFHCPIMYIHLDACVSVGVRMCQHPFLMFLFVCFLTERPGETYFSIFGVVTVIVFHSLAIQCFCDSSSRHRD